MRRLKSPLFVLFSGILCSGCIPDNAARIFSPAWPVGWEKLSLALGPPLNPDQPEVLAFARLEREGAAPQFEALRSGRDEPLFQSLPGIEARHPSFGTSMATRRKPYGVAWDSCSQARELEVRLPQDWTLSGYAVDLGVLLDDEPDAKELAAEIPAAGWTTVADGPGFKLSSVVLRPTQETVVLQLHQPQPWFRNGGPVLALGGRSGDGVDHSFVTRLGYEVGFGDIGILDLHLESDGRDMLQVGSTLEAASWTWEWVPSLSLGAGANARLQPKTELGARLQLAAQWSYFGLVASYDLYSEHDEGMLLARFSL